MTARAAGFMIAVALATAAMIAGCRRDTASAPQAAGAAHAGPAGSSLSGNEQSNRRTGCASQAARVAAHAVWRTGVAGRPPDPARRWTEHYSEKYDECYVLIERSIPVGHGADVIVSELWEAFDGAVVAEFTSDPRDAVRRSVCQVSVSDEPFTSCRVARYFIDEHMRH